MVWNSRDAQVTQRHRGLVQLMKEKRAEGHFAGQPLEQRIMVYDAALPAHASSLKALGLSSQGLPLLCLTRLNGQGIPVQVIWKTSYPNADQAVAALDKHLGIVDRNQSKEPPDLVLVGSSDDLVRQETEAKLRALLQSDWKGARLHGEMRLEESVPDVSAPALALLDSKDGRLLWQKPLNQPDVVLQALGQRLGLVYKFPDRLRWPKDGSELMRVSGGTVTIGRANDDMDCPSTQVKMSEYYYMGRTEVTVAQFRRFVEAGNYQTDAERAGRSFVFVNGKFQPVSGAHWKNPKGDGRSAQDNLPVVHITINDALAYCKWAGLRLPNEAEWENATGRKTFPWGDQWNPAAACHSVGKGLGGAGTPAPVGSFPAGASPWGCLDMAGNVYEWTSNLYQPYAVGGPTNSRMNAMRQVIRGGSFGNDEVRDFHTFRRTPVGAQDSTEAQGFRVCQDGTRPPQ